MSQQEPFSLHLTLDQFGDTMVTPSGETFDPYVAITMLEMAKQKIIGQFMMGIVQQRQQQPNIIVPDQGLVVPR